MADNEEYEFENNENYFESSEYETESFEYCLRLEEYSSIARKAENCTVPDNILLFFHSYGYDCRKYFNLCVVDTNTVAFASGNLIHFFDILEKRIWFVPGSTGGGIGHISKNPMFNHIAVGENGIDPPIKIYEWPSMRILISLTGGTTRRYSHLAYSPDGHLLVSQGGESDYFLTVWDWKHSKIILRCKSYVQDVFNVTFSKYIPGHITSCGSGHIKFWKISETFTGLKLKGETGRFGKTEISDIVAVYAMGDEKVVSGCEWGNILLWEEGLIKLEVSKKGKPAHKNYVSKFDFVNGELVSIGTDGWIRFWFYETIDLADLQDNEYFLEILPITEFHVTDETDIENIKESAMLMCIEKQELDNPESTLWYAQDGNGGMWLLDLSTLEQASPPQKILTCHAGAIIDITTADYGPFIATIDLIGHLHIYNYFDKKLIVMHKFYDGGRQVVWLPYKVERTGSTIVCGFSSGVIRVITVAVQLSDRENDLHGNYVRLIQVLKPHSKPISIMSINNSCSLLVSGAEDCTVFAFNIKCTTTYPQLIPIGYVEVNSIPTCFAWHPEEDTTILIGSLLGDCTEVVFPNQPESYTTTSYKLVKSTSVSFKFESVKSSIQREIVRQQQEKEKEMRLAKKREEMEKLMTENPQISIDEEAFLMDFEEFAPLPEIYIPEIPNRILIVQYVNNEKIWLFLSGFDAGYIYEYTRPLLKSNNLICSRLIDGGEDTEIYSCLFYKNKYLFLATQFGEIRVSKLKKEDPADLSDYWILPIHDYYNGKIPKMILSYDKSILLTCGFDGNLFSFVIKDDKVYKSYTPLPDESFNLPNNVDDIEDADYPTLEDVITKKERNRIMVAAKMKKEETLKIIRDLAEEFVQITNRNQNLRPSQQIKEFELDPRITEDLEMQLEAQMELTKQKLAFKVEKSKLELEKLVNHFIAPITCLPFAVRSVLQVFKPLMKDRAVHSLREQKLDIDSILKDISLIKHMGEEKVDKIIEEKIHERKEELELPDSDYLGGLLGEDFSDLSGALGMQINQMLSKYKEKKERLIEREKEWNQLNAKKPDISKHKEEDTIVLEQTKNTIGEYNLKMSPAYGLSKRDQETAVSKFKQLLNCRSKLHELREGFNDKLRAVREKKQKLQKEVLGLSESLRKIHAEIPAKSVRSLPQPPVFDYDLEFPEQNLELEKYTPMSEKMKQMKRERLSIIIDLSFDPFDLEYQVLLLDDKSSNVEEIESLQTLVSSSKMKIKDQSMQSDILKTLNANDLVQTPWEKEMKRRRMNKKIYEQDCIIRYIGSKYNELEEELKELEEYRVEVIYESVYMNLFLLTLFEEFSVLNECEAEENKLREKVNGRLNEKSMMKSKMLGLNNKIAKKEDDIRKLQAKIKDVGMQFGIAIIDNRFHDFLQKIYRKKYSTKQRDGSQDSTTQSSESTSSESEGTEASDMETIPFDENICPPGCERELYELAFSLRTKRHGFEEEVKEVEKEIELLRKELDLDGKALRVTEANLKGCEASLEEFMLEKQRRLNDIDVTIALKFHQLQHVSEYTPSIKHCVVFNKKELSNLYGRIGELQQETLKLEEKRKKNESHLRRIKCDCKYMQSQNKKLEEEIKEEMINKFGRKVSLTSLYETVLQRMIFDAKSDMHQTLQEFDKQIKNIKESCEEKSIVLENLIKDNTEKLSLLTVLEQEKAKLKKILKNAPISEKEMVKVERKNQADLEKLKNILQSQIQQKRLLENDIKNLRMDTKTLPPICLKKTAI